MSHFQGTHDFFNAHFDYIAINASLLFIQINVIRYAQMAVDYLRASKSGTILY